MAKLHSWHRTIGVSSAVLVIILALTGLLLNFSDELKLNTINISSNVLLNHYNIGDFEVTSFQVGEQLISQASQFIYLDGEYVLTLNQALLGAIRVDDNIVLATTSSLLLIDTEGQIIDEISSFSGLPENPLGIALSSDGLPVLRGVNTYWKGSDELSAWQPLQGPHPKWVAAHDTPQSLNQLIQAHARSHEIHLERVMLDLHSGRLLGNWGRYLMSFAAVFLLALAITGMVIWIRKRPG